MKRLLLSVLVLTFLFNLMGLQWMFIHKQNLHRERTWSSLHSGRYNKVEEIITSSGKFDSEVFVIDEYELVFHGKHYDIKRIEKSGNETHYYCIADNEEDKMLSSFDGFEKNNVSSATTVHSKTSGLLKSLTNYFLPVFPAPFIESNNPLFVTLCLTFKLSKPFIDEASMPPDMLASVIANEA